MNTAEATIGRREFLNFSFARKRSNPDKRAPLARRTPTPEPPRWGGFKLTQRQFIVGGLITAASITTGLAKPWERFASSEQTEPDTLDSLVAQAKKMEEEFNSNYLTDEPTINNFTSILANIFSKDTQSSWTKEQITKSIIWTRNPDEFIKIVRLNSDPQRGTQADAFTDIAAITTDNKKIVVNLANPAFNTSLLRRGGFPKDWNALKSLRRVLLHEFNHLTIIAKRDDEFFSLTDLPKDIKDPLLEGFTLQFKEQGKTRKAFHTLNELTVETITTERNNRLFGPTPPILFIDNGVNLIPAQQRLKQILGAAGIKITDLEKFHQSSDLYGFLTNLSANIDFPSDSSLADKINYALNALDAVLYNNQAVIQEYITKASSARK